MVAWLLSFGLTLATELPVAAWVLRSEPRWRVLGAAALCTSLTHPAFWFLLPRLFDSYWAYITVGELGIIAVEAVVLAVTLRLDDWRLALQASALMNGVSYLVGLSLHTLVG